MIWKYGDYEALSYAAAGLFAQRARLSIEKTGRFSVALSGGHTPERAYQILADHPFSDRIPWEGVHIFWGDERCVPPEDPMSNQGMIQRTLLDQVPIPPSQIHPMGCWQSPGSAAMEYEKFLHEYFGSVHPNFDLVFLGLGENGHTASLFPGKEVLHDTEHWVAEVYLPDQNLYRLTLTAGIINQASMIAFLVSGAKKASVLKEILEGKFNPERLPAQLIKPQNGDLLWLVDQEASALLTKEV
jgi:6-phosphogluconolactonase